jgi:hypothetical protein
MSISFSVTVDDLSSTLQLYDRVQVWRAADGDPLGPYSEITADTAQGAVVDSTASGPFAVSGLSLSVELNHGDPLVIAFVGTDPIPLSVVVDKINSVFAGLATLTPANKLRLKNPLTGTGSSIKVYGSARIPLGLPVDIAYGQAARILIGNLNSIYNFTDLAGDATHFYKTRFYSTVTKSVSDFSDPFQGAKAVVIPQTLLSLATVDLVDGAGTPVVGRRVILVPVQAQIIPYNNRNYGMLPGNDRIELTTNEAGHAEIELVRGATVRVFFEGSSYAREFVVPDEDFDLLSVISTQPDPFDIVQAPPMPIRES